MFNGSIVWKFLMHVIMLLGVSAGGYYYLYGFENVMIPSQYVFMYVTGLIGLFVLLILFDFLLPLRIVLLQVQALLAGKTYKKIFTYRSDEVGILAYFFNQVMIGFSKVSGDLKDRDRMVDELAVASELQRGILPLELPSVTGLKVVAKNKSASEVGGDSFNMLQNGDNVYIYIGDVTGHGVAAGLIMTMANSLISVFVDKSNNAYEIVVGVNKYIKKHIKKAMFMTMVMLCWNKKTRKLTYVGAGHEHILIYRQSTGKCETLVSGGVALGMVSDNSKLISEKEIVLEHGDLVVLYTDGITEARNDYGELYGLERLESAVVEYASEYSADGVNYHIALDVTNFMGKHPQEDDITLIVLQRDDTIVNNSKDLKVNSVKW